MVKGLYRTALRQYGNGHMRFSLSPTEQPSQGQADTLEMYSAAIISTVGEGELGVERRATMDQIRKMHVHIARLDARNLTELLKCQNVHSARRWSWGSGKASAPETKFDGGESNRAPLCAWVLRSQDKLGHHVPVGWRKADTPVYSDIARVKSIRDRETDFTRHP